MFKYIRNILKHILLLFNIMDIELNDIDKVNNLNKYIDSESDIDIDSNEDFPEISEINLTKKEIMTYKVIDKYYKKLEKEKIEKMIDIIDGKSKISLRLLDWFITNYSDKYKIKLKKDNIPEKEDIFDTDFNVHIGYKSQLKSFRKKYFDPFRRRQKFKYYFDKEKTLYLYTTIGQLNFFKWAFSNNIIQYVDDNFNTISKKMVLTSKLDKNKKKEKENENEINDDNSNLHLNNEKKVKIQKHGVNISAKQNINNNEVKIVLSFD